MHAARETTSVLFLGRRINTLVAVNVKFYRNNTLWSNYSRANPLDELNIHGFFNNATQNWDDKLSKV
ncbi:hypothetical protein Y032_0013g2060 [Ancylostoma ceylanicum]|uniref:Uncharacterized protein n=1 Tax=Ancylostoma ceylanicum TaxID=53326 RepID=A0A016VCD7_9BILA|nr:hypothetical protein Y032_0013g2060 [Ancylostoma ceylanicum]